MIPAIILIGLAVIGLGILAYRLDAKAHNRIPPRPDKRRNIYRMLIASKHYSWRQFGTRQKARQAARHAARLAFGDWNYCWRNYLRYLPGAMAQ